VLDVHGEVDLYSSPKLQESIHGLIEDGHRRLLINLEDVEFMDSSGLGVLVGSLKRLKEHEGDLALVVREGSIMKVITITGLDKVFSIYGSVAEAASA
jgi:anti-sigma B factor antagonist